MGRGLAESKRPSVTVNTTSSAPVGTSNTPLAEASRARDRAEQQPHAVFQTFVDPEERKILAQYAHGSPMSAVLDAVRAVRRHRQLYTLSAELLDDMIRRFEACYDREYPVAA